jgi:hypothetical protein
MTGYDQDAVGHLFATGLEYYVAGRSAARCHLSRVAGNILHHAIGAIGVWRIRHYRRCLARLRNP